ncbi:MAG: thioredoxin domain-containing protein [Bacteroidota bacterium]
MPNRLALATSPYLLQHAHNPVDWYEWGSEALQKAVAEDKPILVSIGYSSCHWCHVMERESFENTDIAAIMNAHFVCIKVDREERPDVDHLYMEAVQAMGQNGGWPLNVFLTPQQQPFFGGTYFPPRQWAHLLKQIHKAFGEKRKDIEDSAQDLTRHLNISDLTRFAQQQSATIDRKLLAQMFEVLQSRYDATYGGLAKAPKFIMPTIWQFLLRYHQLTRSQEALQMVTHTLTHIGRGGIYDQLAGGFARYSVDERWFAPHFEKMLYDNAQLLSLYAEAYQATQTPLFKKILQQTIGWLQQEMQHPQGGFYSALDADSEGVEGKYYTFTWAEWTAALSDDAETAAQHFNITPEGNWEHGRNILTAPHDANSDASLQRWKDKLAAAQQKRVRPGLDDKMVASWNCMLVKGLVDASLALNEPAWLRLAVDTIGFVENHLIQAGQLRRSFKDRPAATEGFLEDYAFLIQAYLALYQATFDDTWLAKAEQKIQYVYEHFFDEKDGYFHYASRHAEKLIAQKKEIFDNVIPASNSVMARNLLHAGTLLGQTRWTEQAHTMATALSQTIAGEPGYLSNWGVLLLELAAPLREVAIVGPEAIEHMRELRKHYVPFAVFMGTTTQSKLPLLADKHPLNGSTTLFVCYQQTCQTPVHTVEEALRQLP